ncbi:MAG: hypothetical protein FJ241_02115 [Nitrospira sp.]|nr:hypothetical protein [Nitrospira sp.]
MKKFTIALMIILVFCVSAQAQVSGGTMGEQKGEMKPQCMMMGEGMSMMPTMHMCQHMMMGQNMMMRDTMQMMIDIVKMQQRIIRGIRHPEKRELMMEMGKMIDKMDKMMSEMRGMTMKGMVEPPPPPPPLEPKKEEPKKDSPAQLEAPKSDPHKH